LNIRKIIFEPALSSKRASPPSIATIEQPILKIINPVNVILLSAQMGRRRIMYEQTGNYYQLRFATAKT
jgi:hypothetical protein